MFFAQQRTEQAQAQRWGLDRGRRGWSEGVRDADGTGREVEVERSLFASVPVLWSLRSEELQ